MQHSINWSSMLNPNVPITGCKQRTKYAVLENERVFKENSMTIVMPLYWANGKYGSEIIFLWEIKNIEKSL